MNRTTRVAFAILVLAVALPAALYVHQRHTIKAFAATCTDYNPNYVPTGSLFAGGRPKTENDCEQASGLWQLAGTISHHPTWEDPAALAIVLVALAVGIGIVGVRRRSTDTAALQ